MNIDDLKELAAEGNIVWNEEWNEQPINLVEVQIQDLLNEEEIEEEPPLPEKIDVLGIRGKFHIDGDDIPVHYLLTSASLASERDNETEKMSMWRTHMQYLLGFSKPVREIIDVSELNFDELMQRDLDDYRISQEIMTYLTGEPPTGIDPSNIPGDRLGAPRFFPPVIGVIVPYNDDEGRIAEKYPEAVVADSDKKIITTYGNCFMLQHNKMQPSTQLTLYPAKSKLVIVDGQHRAMAVLAAYRTAHNKWAGVTMSGQPSDFLSSLYKRNEVQPEMLKNLDLPICLIYFPTLTEGQDVPKNIIDAIRKLFLDVNRNAKQPSEIRRVLLDDYSLVSICLRHLLNSISTNAEGTFKIHHIDVDSDSEWENYSPNRKLCIANVRTMYELVRRVLLEKNSSISIKSFTDSKNTNPVDTTQLGIALNFDSITGDEWENTHKFEKANVKDSFFPRSIQDHVKSIFNAGWGKAIIEIYENFYPFKTHSLAADKIRAELNDLDEEEVLSNVKLALLEGQGARESIRKLALREKEIRGDEGEKTILEKSWERIQSIEGEKFYSHRAKAYYGVDFSAEIEAEKIERATRIHNKFRTVAFQLGILQGLMHIMSDYTPQTTYHTKLRTRPSVIITALNKSFESDEVRYVSMDENHEFSFFNLLKKGSGDKNLNLLSFQRFKGYFMELLHLNKDDLNNEEKTMVSQYIGTARHELFHTLWEKRRKELVKKYIDDNPDTDETQDEIAKRFTIDAREDCKALWKNVYKESFGINKGSFTNQLFAGWIKTPPS